MAKTTKRRPFEKVVTKGDHIERVATKGNPFEKLWREYSHSREVLVVGPGATLPNGDQIRSLAMPDDSIQVVRLVREGLRFGRLREFQEASGLSLEQIARVASISPRTLTRRQGEGRLKPDESDRLLRVSRVFDLAVELFEGDRAAAREWLQRPQPGLGGEVPLELASTDVGAREVEKLIARLEHGILA